MEERLPIKFFSKRDEDNQHVEGMSSSDPPKWFLEGEALDIKMKMLESELDSVFSNIDWESRNSMPVVIKAELNNDAIAKTHRRKIQSIFSTSSNNVIGMGKENTLLVNVASSDEKEKIKRNLKNTGQFAYAISGIDYIEAYKPTIMKNKDTSDNYKVRLIDFQDYALNAGFRSLFEKRLINKNISYAVTKYSNSLFIYKLKGLSHLEIDSLNEEHLFDLAYEVVPMPVVEAELDVLEVEKNIMITHPSSDEKCVTIGVLDNGIEPIPQLVSWIDGTRMSPYPNNVIAATHGTFVAGVITYGDELQDSTLVGSKNIKVFDAAVYPDTRLEPLEEDELIANIREIIRSKSKEIKIWNLSISMAREVSDNLFSDFAIALDDIQNEFNVLICKSAGNCRNFKDGKPIGRLHEGADSVRSLVVGSIAQSKVGIDIASCNNPSPFSRIGPGPAYIIKPEIAHYGGNAGINSRGEIVESGVFSFSKNGKIIEHAGTSFSTPRVAALAAGLHREMEEDFDPLLLKALIIHSAEYPIEFEVPNSDRTRFSGFGLPSTVSRILYNSPDEVTLILRDSMAKGQYIDIKDFPMPECLIRDGFYTGQVIVTLVYDPILDESQGFEYCQSNMDVRFGSYDEKTARDTEKRSILNPVGRGGTQNLLRGTLYSKTKMRENINNFSKKERMLIQYGDKYYPVKKYAVDLNELTDGNKQKFTTPNKQWFLTLDSVYRSHIEDKAKAEGLDLSQDFCLIITIKDPKGDPNVYTGVTQKLDQFNFWHSNIKLSESVNVRV